MGRRREHDQQIRASAEPEYTRRCAKLVDDRIHDIRLAAGLIEGHKAAILAALSILMASVNIFGGFLVTRRMLAMFQKS